MSRGGGRVQAEDAPGSVVLCAAGEGEQGDAWELQPGRRFVRAGRVLHAGAERLPGLLGQLRPTAHNSLIVKQRAGALMGVIRNAAPSDPAIAELWTRIQAEFYDILRPIVGARHTKQALRPGLDVGRATDILWTLNHPDLWLLLVGERGWTPAEWEQWFGDTTCSQLLAPRTRRNQRKE